MKWRPIPRYPDYEISEVGDVRRVTAAATRLAGFVVRPANGGQYARISLTSPNGRKTCSVHRLVCEAFHGLQPSPKHQVAHADGNPFNNDWRNLRWATPKENQADRKLHGTWPAGEGNGNAALTWDIVRRARARFDAKQTTARELAAEFGVSNSAMERVCNRRTWKEEAARDALDALLGKLKVAAI